MRISQLLRRTAIAVGALVATSMIALFGVIRATLPEEDGRHVLPGLSAAVEIEFDIHHIPRIVARRREDAYEALGYVTARDRLFQMDLNRRSAAGRLAEVLGESVVKSDIRFRTLGLEQVAARVVAALPAAQRVVLEAYGAGVRRAMEEMHPAPLEFMLLGYRPEAWRAEDSILVLLGIAARYSDGAAQERMASVMRRALPATIVDFLTPAGNCYNERLAPRDPARCSGEWTAALDDIARLFRASGRKRTSGLIGAGETLQGSNAWVVGPSRTRDGRAILANDMHLPLSAPGIWYRAELSYGSARLGGLTIPGVPLVISGSNGSIAWGFTSVEGDFLDLVRVEAGRDPGTYRATQGDLPFVTREETIAVRGAAARKLTVRETIWGPVSSEPLLGEDVAMRWTALDPSATNLDLMDLDEVADVREASRLFRRAGGPPLNVLLADSRGGIAWTIMSRLPKRFGTSGLFSESWANGDRGWDGYLSAEETPAIVDPPSGFLVNTNNRMLGRAELEREIGHDFSGGFRAWRVTEWLRDRSGLAETDMLALQLDTATEFYRYYQALALRALDARKDEESKMARRYLAAWDGRAESASLGLPLLVEFRSALIDALIAPIVARCAELEPSFKYSWTGVDVPLQRIIDSGREDLLPDRGAYPDWNALIVALLQQSARRLVERRGAGSIEDLSWGKVNTVDVAHPVLGEAPIIGRLFDMPAEPLPGCRQCVRLSWAKVGASARMIVAPSHEEDGVLEIPAGQSGQPGSPYYGDQHGDWVKGLAAPFRAGAGARKLILTPAAAVASARM